MIKKLKKILSVCLFPPLDISNAKRVISEEEGVVALEFDQQYSAGFYMVECRAEGLCQKLVLKLVFSNTVKETLAYLPVRLQHVTKRMVYLQSDVGKIKLELIEQSTQRPVSISIGNLSSLRFIPLRRTFAYSRMLKRLHIADSLARQRAESKSQSTINFLYEIYDRSFLYATSGEHYQLWINYVEMRQMSPFAGKEEELSEIESQYCFFYDSDCQVSGNAKEILFAALQENPGIVLVYCDEDSIDKLGLRTDPWFKPDWNPDLFLSLDYVSSCYACRYDWYKKHEEVFSRLGSRLALTHLLPDQPTDTIFHLPQILLHREKSNKDTNAKSRFCKQRIEVLDVVSLLADRSIEQGMLADSVRVRYPLPSVVPLVSLLIPTRDNLAVLKPCVESILAKTIYPYYEILILDNQSEEVDTLRWLEEIVQDKRVSIIKYDKPFNYSAINNFGASQANGSVIGLINNDVEVISPDWLIEMVSQAMRPEIGCVGAKLYYSNGQIQHGGVILGLGDVAGHAHRFFARDDDGYHGRLKLVQNYSAVTAACLLVRREIYDEVGGLEEKHLTVAYNDFDFCLRVREAGYRNLWTPYAELYHHESISRGEDDTPAKQARYQKEVAYMQKTWGEQLVNDPCYNPNLCRRREDFSLPDVLF
ncbi:MAG: glycosyltransferase family 2 protein [Thiolinea sp.]